MLSGDPAIAGCPSVTRTSHELAGFAENSEKRTLDTGSLRLNVRFANGAAVFVILFAKMRGEIRPARRDREKALHGKQDQMLVQIYREIHDAVKAYSQANGIHVVLQYSDSLDPSEFFMSANIQRKFKGSMAGAYVPLYIADGVDISQAVVTMLNNNIPAAAPAAGARQ